MLQKSSGPGDEPIAHPNPSGQLCPDASVGPDDGPIVPEERRGRWMPN